MTTRRADLLWTTGLAAVAVLLYSAAFAAGFLNWDDDRFITANPLFARGGWAYVHAAWTSVQMEAYHPLHLLAYLPDRLLWKDAPLGFHLLNLALFAADAGLLYRLARRLAPPLAAGLAVLLFVVHPLCVESVMWISARKDLLALLFFVLVLLREDRVATARPSLLGLLLFAGALLSKTSTVCLPLVLVAWLVFLRAVPWRMAVVRALPYVGVAVAAGIVTILVWRAKDMILVHRPLSVWMDVPATLGVYARRVLVPVDLSPIYAAVPRAATWLAAGALAAGLAFVATYRRLPGAGRFAFVAFVAALAPVSNLIPIYFRFADRYALLALAVLVPPVALALAQVQLQARRAFLLLLVPVVGLLAFATCTQSRAWLDSAGLFQQAVRAQPDALYARLKLGETRRDRHEWQAAVEQYQAAIRLAPDSTLGYAGLMYAYAQRAEEGAILPAGSAHAWLAALGPALVDPQAFARLLEDVSATKCAPCRNSLLLLGLHRYPQSDTQLLAAAKKAIELGHADVALVYLSVVQDAGSAEYARLQQAALTAVRGKPQP